MAEPRDKHLLSLVLGVNLHSAIMPDGTPIYTDGTVVYVDNSVIYVKEMPEQGKTPITLGNMMPFCNVDGILTYGKLDEEEKPWATWRYYENNVSISVYKKGMMATIPNNREISRLLKEFPLKIPESTADLVYTASRYGEGEIIWSKEKIISTDETTTTKRKAFEIQEEEKECCICLSEKPSVTLLPCNHKVLCFGCSKVLVVDTCPLCRTAITSRI